MTKIKAIDLFAGCGGLMDGFEQSGHYDTVAAVEWEKVPCQNLENRLRTKWKYSDADQRVLRFDIQRTDDLFNGWTDDPDYGSSVGLDKLIEDAGGIDVIIGGPPCQAYSIAGRVRDEHGMKNDYRNYLFESYIKVLERYRPKAFLFENVPGILSAKPGDRPIIEIIQESFEAAGYQKLSIDNKNNTDCMNALIRDLADGDIEMTTCHEKATEQDFEALRKFGLIFIRDVASGESSLITEKFEEYLTDKQRQRIMENFPVEKTSDDITISYDQASNLHDAIVQGLHYPELKGEDDEVDFETVVDFMMQLRRLFKWDIYEKDTLGKPGTYRLDSVIRWYSTILLRWIRGNGLQVLVSSAVTYKEKNPETGVWSGKYRVAERYDKNSKYHKNLVIAESLSVIENVLLFSISNYFRKFSIEFKAVHQVENFDNDWYEFVEYGTTNPDTIFLQQSGFSREASLFIQRPSNYSKYVDEVDGNKKIKLSILECGNIGVETEAADIQYNVPELFIE